MDQSSYLRMVISQFEQYKDLGERAIEQLSDEELYFRKDPALNSVAIIMKHMAGNMISRWTDFLTSDGEKPWRDRENEFEAPPKPRSALINYWEKGWAKLFDTLHLLTDEDVHKTVTIRGEVHTVQAAIQRQLAHYAYHVGQLVLLARQFRGTEWKSLSIPKGGSEKFNQKMRDNH